MPGWLRVTGVILLVVALLATATAAAVQTRRLARARAEISRLEHELAEERAEPQPDRGSTPGGITDALGQLLEQLLGGLSSGAQLAGLTPCLDQGIGEAQPIAGRDAGAQIAEISDRVEVIRDHRFTYELSPQFRSGAEIGRRITDEVMASYPPEEADLDRRMLASLGAIPPALDLRQARADLLAGQVAGFYDSESGELVVRADDPGAPLDPVAQIALAHELVHALTDAVLGLPDDRLEGPTDHALAALALVEGDAVLAQQLFTLQAVALDQQLGLLGDPAITGARGALEGVPHYLRAELEFPYLDGAAFVCGLHERGGWAAVDAAYRDLPATTAQILFPDRYTARAAPADPRDPPAPGSGWALARADSFGAAQLLWLFEAPGDDPGLTLNDPRDAVEGWAGGEIHLYTDRTESAVGIALVERAGGRLCDAVAEWYAAAFPDGADVAAEPGERFARDGARQDAVLRCAGAEVRVGIGPDIGTARALAR